MRMPVVKVFCFVLGNATVLVSASVLAQGLGGSHVGSGNPAEALGVFAFVVGIGGLALEASGILPRVHAFVARVTAGSGSAEQRPEPGAPDRALPN